MPYTIRIFTSD